MCLLVVAGDLGAAHVGLDLQRLVLAFAPGLTDPERTLLGRRVLTQAGRCQPAHATGRVICLCGEDLDVSDRFSQAHSIPMPAITGHEWAEARRLLGSVPIPRHRLAGVGRRLFGSLASVGVLLFLFVLVGRTISPGLPSARPTRPHTAVIASAPWWYSTTLR